MMVPRADIVAVPLDTPLGDLLACSAPPAIRACRSMRRRSDDPRGMVHIRDFLDYLASRAETAKTRRRRKAPLGCAAISARST